MANISLKGEDIFLKTKNSYFFIDAMYLNDVKNELNSIDYDSIENDIKVKIFPYTETPFALIIIGDSGENKSDGLKQIEINKIKKTGNEEVDNRYFSTDTGLVVIVEKSIFLDFLKHFDYDTLVEGMSQLINISYWTDLEKRFGVYNCGLILSPGVNKGFDFDGSGVYKLEI